MNDHKVPSQEIMLLTGGFIALISVQLIFQRPPFNDERDYLSNVALLHQYGFGKNYLINLVGSAGPLYSMVHFLFEPLTHLESPYIRWVNIGFLISATYITFRTISLFNHPVRFYSFYIMAIPMTYVIGGQALTEMPALFFFSAAIYLVIKTTTIASTSNPLIKLVLAGFCMSLAIVGRQPYLLTLAAFPILFISKENYTKNLLSLAITLLFSIALPCYVFVTWKGLVPTIESQLYIDIARSGTSYRPDFFLLCVFYFAVSMLLISPGFFLLPRTRNARISGVVCFILLTAANFIFHWIELLPVKGLFRQILTPGQIYIFSGLCGSAVIFSGFYFLVCLYKQLQKWLYRKDMLFFAAALVLMAVSCIKITWGYTSRYAAQSIPLLILLGSFFYRNSKYNGAAIIIGIIIGLVSLISYFFNPA